MKLNTWIIAAIFSLVLLGSCEPKEEPVEVIEETIFSLKGKADGAMVLMEAGKNNYYMNGGYETLPVGVLSFYASMAPLNCTQCPPALSIAINNFSKDLLFIDDKSLFTGTYVFRNDSDLIRPTYEVEFTPETKGSSSGTFLWDFGNGKTSTSAEKKVSTSYRYPGTMPVTLTADYNGCKSSISQQIALPPPFENQVISFNTNALSTRSVLFNSIPVNQQANVSWDFGDGKTGSGTITTHDYAQSGVFKACMTYTHNSKTITICRNVATSDSGFCISNFSYKATPVIDSFAFSQVNITWKDEAGRIYTSSKAEQVPGNHFTIEKISEYLQNEKGQKTKILTIRFDCLVSDGIRIIHLQNIEGKVAMAYPR